MKEVTYYKKRQGKPLFALCAAIVCNIVGDLAMRPGRAKATGGFAHIKINSHVMTRRLKLMRRIAINDLKKFKEWPLFVRAANAGMDLPTDEQIQRIINMKPSKVGDNFYKLAEEE